MERRGVAGFELQTCVGGRSWLLWFRDSFALGFHVGGARLGSGVRLCIAWGVCGGYDVETVAFLDFRQSFDDGVGFGAGFLGVGTDMQLLDCW
jgi:hypothetical protein